MMRDMFPPLEQALELEPEELAVLVLRFLANSESNMLNLNNFQIHMERHVYESRSDIIEAMTEAWMWLEKGTDAPPTGARQRLVLRDPPG